MCGIGYFSRCFVVLYEVFLVFICDVMLSSTDLHLLLSFFLLSLGGRRHVSRDARLEPSNPHTTRSYS